MNIAILTFDGFNELDSLIALGILNRVKRTGWNVRLACPAPEVTSMNGVTVRAQATLEDAARADAVIIGSETLDTNVDYLSVAQDKPVLPWKNDEELLPAYLEFFKSLTEEEVPQ